MKTEKTWDEIIERSHAINEVYAKTYSAPLPGYLQVFGTKSQKESWYNKRFMKLMTERNIKPFIK